ncbi:cellulose synthase subunit BcsC-related outer membrane protein [Crenobacter sp. SG2305]|uniref:cellulose synthase subunit BcsC-related outer membrane protein n=1 Tax=Crenobacter oryzisoli TaxID=3056844 RepID=UPI0025AA62B8|nr:cellulose synthase subunit BcsC-related outer membrane protein [Crenobacter sp. SG2305]MDN0084380.1 cellulose synthase subunit BcsC-related outer membrane protein [Crenobacter sp. SG2305]
MSRIIPLFVLSAAAAAVPPIFAAPAQVDPVQTLLNQARMWQGLNRDDLAQQALDKLQRIAPNNPEGLTLLAQQQLKNRQDKAAAATLATLKRLYPGYEGIARIEQQQRLAGADLDKLLAARALARSGKVEAAIAALDELYKGRPPDGEPAIEYWQLVARSPNNGWARARAGLTALVAANPDNRRYRLTLADLYLNKPPAPPQVMAELKALSVHQDSRSQALGIWRRALLQEDLGSVQRDAFIAYLREVPDDEAVKEKLAGLDEAAAKQRALLADPAYQARLAAGKSLDQNRLADAERQLQLARQRFGNEADVLGNLGRLREKQGRYDEAIDYYHQAEAKDTDKTGWQRHITDARFAQRLAEAEQAEASGQLGAAEAALTEAGRLKPKSADLRVAQGQLWLRQGKPDAARDAYQAALTLEPDNGAALSGLIDVYVTAGDLDGASRYLDTLAPARRKVLGRAYPAAVAKVERERADRLLAAGRNDEAIAALQRAVAATPQDPWNRFALANAYAAAGQAARGEQLLRQLADAPAPDSEVLYAYALFRSRAEDDLVALQALQRIPPAQRSASMLQLQRRLWLRETLRLADADMAAGRPDRAERRLALAEGQLAGDPERLAELAKGWLTLGQPERGMTLMRRVYTERQTPAVALLYADLLLDAERSDEARTLLDKLPSGTLDKGQQDSLRAARSTLAVRLADRARADGHNGQARALLTTALAADPTSSSLLRNLASLDLAEGHVAESRQRLEAVLQRDPNDDEARLLLIDADRLSGQRAAALEGIDRLLAEPPKRSVDFRLRVIDRLMAMGEQARADQAVDKLVAEGELTPRLWGYTARQARRADQPDPALLRYQAGFAPAGLRPHLTALMASPDPDPAPVLQASPPSTALSRLMLPGQAAVAAEVPALPGELAGVAPSQLRNQPLLPVAAEPAGNADLHAEYAELIDKRTGDVQAGLDVTARHTGTGGQSRMLSVQTPLLVNVPAPHEGKFFVRSDPITMSAGSLDPNDSYNRDRFGSIYQKPEADRAGYGQQAGRQSASGVAVGVGYENDDWRLDVGTTPIGFPVQDVVGGVKHYGKMGELNYNVDVSRRPLTSSVLTYAGTKDPVTGQTWGGVRATGASVGVGYDQGGDYGVWSNFGYHTLTGENVLDNHRLTAMGGVYWRAQREDTRRITLGLNSINFWYKENLSQFTFGQGGYYSPQRYNSLSLPVSYAARNERLSYLLRASVSVSNSREKDELYFPLEAAGAKNPSFTASEGWGSGASLSGAFEYQMAPLWVLGGSFDLEYSQYYQPSRASLYLRYLFAPSAKPLPFPPEPLQPYSSF